MQRRSLISFLILNAIVTFLMASAVILVNEARQAAQPTPPGRLLQVVITATPNPEVTSDVVYIVVTATPPRTPSGVVIQPTSSDAGGGGVPTLDPSLLPPNIGVVETPTPAPTDESGCPVHIIKQGDILGRVAPAYGVTVEDIMKANDLTERDVNRLQIGQKLIIPVAGCGLPTLTPSLTPTTTYTPTPPPTATTAPLVSSEQIKLEVVQIISPGDITNEGIELRNISGGQVEISGWTLRDARGNVFTFPDFSMYEGRRLIIYTREGQSGALALYWGLKEAIWNDPAQSIIIADAEGNVQLNSPISALPTPSGGFVPTPTPGN
ncbi:MAG: lamin tail domain-containing protein [Anaerolineae bacterium]|nr:lamin tail domain-containing protein [Anaerolineae bacterium]CAG1010006.1 hypothetical protein ANRL4_04123 [Anaerolineae bacterium]